MSDTSPKDQSALTSDHVTYTRTGQTAVAVEVWRLTLDGRVISCELRNELRFGADWDVWIRQGGELSFWRRCLDEAFAKFVANGLKQNHLREGWAE